MSEFCFSFLEEQFRDIYLDCARMDKNLIEGDGVESILIAGRIAEKITKAIYSFEGIRENEESQYNRIEKLSNANILPNNIKKDLSEIRRLRNEVYHSGGLNTTNTQPKPFRQSGGLRDYKTGFSEVKDYPTLKNESNNKNYDVSGELAAAREAHKLVFNICVWFYINYSGDKDFIRPKYKVSRRTQDADFLIRLKSVINNGDDFLKLRQNNPNNEIIQILNEIYIKKAPQENKEESVYGINNKDIKIRKPGVPYSKCLGISYDDELFMWRAVHGNKDLGLFESSKEAYEAREIYIHSIPMPKKIKGVYSTARGISFSKIQKLWTVSVKGQIISYHASEKEAIKAREKYLKENGLVDVKVKGGFKTITIEEKNRLKEKAKSKKKSSDIKSISPKSSLKKEIEKSSSKHDSNNSNLNKPSYYDVVGTTNKSTKDNKVKVVKGSKVKDNNKNKKVKISNGNRVSKKNKSKSATISKKKSSKYDGVYYEEGLFMWSAEVDGKHLGLFSSEKEAFEKREEYIKNKSN